ncbi:MAG: MIP/aquaporin family protein [Gemmatimonadales bacterium]
MTAEAPGGRTGRWHPVEYLAEAWALGLFMVAACGFGVLLFHPASPVVALLPAAASRRILMGCAMGLTAALNIYSPWGRRSGAHMNPAVTLTFYRLGKVRPPDLAGYVLAQFAGGALGMAAGLALFGRAVADPSVNYVLTLPGRFGPWVAVVAEAGIAAWLLAVVLWLSSRPRWAPWTGVAAAVLVACYIAVEEPLSGMSMNPARSLGSAAAAGYWTHLWIYFVAPPIGMLATVAIRRRLGARAEHCAKYHHDAAYRCIFCGHRPGNA